KILADTWITSGMRGTGSHDITVENLRVSEDDSLDIFFGQSCIPGPLFAAHLAYFVLHIGAVGIGIAQRAVNEAIALATANKKRLYAPTPLAETGLFQYRIGNADMTLRAARGLLMDETRKVWSNAVAGNSLTPNEQLRVLGTAA